MYFVESEQNVTWFDIFGQARFSNRFDDDKLASEGGLVS